MGEDLPPLLPPVNGGLAQNNVSLAMKSGNIGSTTVRTGGRVNYIIVTARWEAGRSTFRL